jgi:rhodanese-related sulfurtransferase
LIEVAMLSRTNHTAVCLFLIFVTALATSCGASVTPTGTPTAGLVATPSDDVVASPTPTTALAATPTSDLAGSATPIPTEAPIGTPVPEGTPTSPEEVPRITQEELKALMDSGDRIVILDCQPRGAYEEGHIRGAVSMPWRPQLDEEEVVDALALPWDVPIITYCDCGPGEADSADVALQLIRMGFLDVKVLIDPSIRGWMEAGYPID